MNSRSFLCVDRMVQAARFEPLVHVLWRYELEPPSKKDGGKEDNMRISTVIFRSRKSPRSSRRFVFT